MRSDALAARTPYEAIMLMVTVSAEVLASVSGGSDLSLGNNSTDDQTTINTLTIPNTAPDAPTILMATQGNGRK